MRWYGGDRRKPPRTAVAANDDAIAHTQPGAAAGWLQETVTAQQPPALEAHARRNAHVEAECASQWRERRADGDLEHKLLGQGRERGRVHGSCGSRSSR
mmetsp:Transcript_48107/g.152476  ORF Transcript_48107/g.152476 Transcript_48107/m.152476 type:complete len:99 (-) Transcript_48107:24-320(-)